MSSVPIVSIIICTRNRADSLRDTLASMARLRVPEDMPAELLVVDNGSTDHTRRVVEEARLPGLPLRYVFEQSPGQSRARNRGMAESRGTIFLWTDDDCRVPEEWIEGMCRPILKGEADVVAGSIAIAPHLHRPWMTPLHLDWLAYRPTVHKVTMTDGLVGANMAFHRRAAEALGGFDVDLGPGTRGFGDDTLFGWQAAQAGFHIITSPVSVEHHFDPARLARRYWLQDARKRGESMAYLSYHWLHQDSPNAARNLPRAVARLWLERLKRPHEVLRREGAPVWELEKVQEIAYYRGYLEEQKRPRRYDRRGLRPRDADAAAATADPVPREARTGD